MMGGDSEIATRSPLKQPEQTLEAASFYSIANNAISYNPKKGAARLREQPLFL